MRHSVDTPRSVSDAHVTTFTTSPVCGASITRPWPTNIATNPGEAGVPALEIHANARADGAARRAAQAEGSPSRRGSNLVVVAVLAVFCCCTGSREALTISGDGPLTCGNTVGVTGFEPAASSSRTGDHSALPCR